MLIFHSPSSKVQNSQKNAQVVPKMLIAQVVRRERACWAPSRWVGLQQLYIVNQPLRTLSTQSLRHTTVKKNTQVFQFIWWTIRVFSRSIRKSKLSETRILRYTEIFQYENWPPDIFSTYRQCGFSWNIIQSVIIPGVVEDSLICYHKC